MIKLDHITHKVKIAILPIDESASDKRISGNVYIKVPGLRRNQVQHSIGYFFLLDAPQKFKVVAGGEYYREESFDIDIDDYQPVLTTGSKPENPKIRVAEIKLKRK